MKKSKFTDSQILSILKQAEGGAPVSELCRENVISTATILQMALEIWWHGHLDDVSIKRARSRK